MTTIDTWRIILTIVLIASELGIFSILAVRSNILRDQINDAELLAKRASRSKRYAGYSVTRKNEIPRPYSLSRTQFAVWVLVISTSYIYLAFIENRGSPILWDGDTLAILGISAGTTTAGIMIDKSQQDLPRHQNTYSQNFLIDILSDENGISIARFQQILWTVIAAVLYLTQLPGLKGHLPQLDSALLVLSGFSNAAYLTIKVGENALSGANAAKTDLLFAGETPAVSPPAGNDLSKSPGGPLQQPKKS